MLKRVVALLLGALLFPAVANADCSTMPGSRITLFSSNYDPDVLVWDSRRRLLDYVTDSYQLAKLLLPHALLARAGTLAIVTKCRPNEVHPKYRFAPTDALGIRVTTGEYRGHYGWVIVDDVHVLVDHALHRQHP